MAIIGFSCVRGKVSMEEHHKCKLGDAPCGFSATLLDMMIRPTEGREGVQFSPSSIAGCHRQHALQQDHDWYLDPEKAYASLRGTLVHHGLKEEPAPEGTLGVIRELRMHAPIQTSKGEQRFSGQVDEILLLRLERVPYQFSQDAWGGGPSETVLHVAITDWKTKTDIPHSLLEADRRHVYQVNHYAWIVTQVLADYLNNWEVLASVDAEFQLTGNPLPHIDRVVVDGLSVVYISMSKVRRFSSGKLLYAKGKQKTELGEDGKKHVVYPVENEVLELVPLHEFELDYTESLIRHGIEKQLEGKEALAAPLEGEDAFLMCPSCGVKDVCIALGKAQGYNMDYQEGKVYRWK